MDDFDESLFSLIPLPFCAYLYLCLVLNCLLLVHFPQLDFIRPFFQILSNLTLIGLIFVSNYFKYFVEQIWSLDTNFKMKRGLPHHCHVYI